MARRLALAALGLALACEAPSLPSDRGAGGAANAGGAAAVGASGGGATASATTYHGFVRGFVERHCATCHAGHGPAPLAFASWDEVAPVAPLLVDAVSSRSMPPYQPRDGCRELANVDVVRDADIAALEAWRDAEYPEGAPSEYVAPPTDAGDPPLGTPTLTFAIPPYQPPLGPDDNHEVVVLDAMIEDTWVVATEIAPTAPSIVHHANAFVTTDVPPEVPAPTSVLGAYAPGYSAVRLPEGSALFVPAGASLKLVVHYSTRTLALAEGEPVPVDATELRLWTLPAGERPAQQAFFDAISASDLFLPANAAHVEVSGERALSLPGAAIVGVVPHMHLLGTAFRADVLHASGESECLIEVPHYDFNHQALWLFRPDSAAQVAPGDLHRMTCTFDNSQANQPLIDGAQWPSGDVVWGSSPPNEMCIDALLRVAPLSP